MKGAQTLLKAGSEAIKKGATIKVVIKITLKSTVGAVLGATINQIAFKLIEVQNHQNDAFPFNSFIMFPALNQIGSGKTQRRQTVYKKTFKQSKYSSNQQTIIYNF